jgi:CspA family cold shock protein
MKNLTGKIKFYDRSKGFGFIKCDVSGEDYFFHFSKLDNPDEVPEAGDRFSFDIGKNRNGECAINIKRFG